MPRVRFCRGDAYVAGDMIIHIYIDGKKAGSLIGAKPLELELPENAYTVQAVMFGQKGPAAVLALHKDSTVSVSGTRPISLPFWVLAAWILGCTVPWRNWTTEIVRWALTIIVCGAVIARWRMMRPQLLNLQVAEGIISEIPASSKRPS